MLESSEPDLTNRPISQIIEYPDYSCNANLHLQEFLCQLVRLDCIECAKIVKKKDVGTRFVEMRICVMQNSIFHSYPFPVCKLQRVEKISKKVLQL